MKKNKFIPLAVIAGLCIASFTMNKKSCANQESKTDCTKKECKDSNKSYDKKNKLNKKNKYTK